MLETPTHVRSILAFEPSLDSPKSLCAFSQPLFLSHPSCPSVHLFFNTHPTYSPSSSSTPPLSSSSSSACYSFHLPFSLPHLPLPSLSGTSFFYINPPTEHHIPLLVNWTIDQLLFNNIKLNGEGHSGDCFHIIQHGYNIRLTRHNRSCVKREISA